MMSRFEFDVVYDARGYLTVTKIDTCRGLHVRALDDGISTIQSACINAFSAGRARCALSISL